MLVLGAACLLAAAVGAYARYAILDERAFADRAVSVLDSGEVQSEAARRLADRTVSEHPELESWQTRIEDTAAIAVVRADDFAPAFRAAATRMHRAIFSDAHTPAQLIVPGSGAALRAEVTALNDKLKRLTALEKLHEAAKQRARERADFPNTFGLTAEAANGSVSEASAKKAANGM